ncbi:hypothetical protein Patl1_31287 [Pistacia atlantica]|uniref:Uncharacterized protein n=1 Tax=Pistacia atlantica TaxID=434234 RepID=A0ACC1AE28_9ROSI|nr:hypothetical protein Patl1_31287 [Pistacia atlantica]
MGKYKTRYTSFFSPNTKKKKKKKSLSRRDNNICNNQFD